MMINSSKIKPLISFILTIISIILLSVTFMKSDSDGSFLSVIFIFLALGSSSISYFLYLKDTNDGLIEKTIKFRVEEERTKIFEEFNKKDEVVEEKRADLDEIVGRIVPKGNFKSIDSFASKLLQNMGHENEICQGMFFLSNKDFTNYKFVSGYALTSEKPIPDFKPGENLNGQVAISKEIMIIHDIPKEYMNIESGLGTSKPVNLFIAPVLLENNTIAVIEFATFKSNSEFIKEIIEKVTYQIADKIEQIQKS
jgi:hypothetical protein